METLLSSFLARLFVDNIMLHRWWRCHRITDRSFFVRGRQFHVCARCTGILVGYALAPCMFFAKHLALYLFPLFLALMAIDGGTQLMGWRESNNLLRVFSGFGFGLTLLPFIILIFGGIIYGF